MKPLFANCPSLCSAGLMLLFVASTAAAQAQYKVVNADGSVTYTDRPSSSGNARITALGRGGPRDAPVPEIGLPQELRNAVQRYPVTLYTSADCPPCDAGRRLLQLRGVPYNERRISTEEDALALERLVGGRMVPSLSIGAQPLRGLSENDWSAYLDVAGYPRESRLPRGWPIAEATPLVQRAAPVVRAPAPVPEASATAPAEVPPPAGGMRF